MYSKYCCFDIFNGRLDLLKIRARTGDGFWIRDNTFRNLMDILQFLLHIEIILAKLPLCLGNAILHPRVYPEGAQARDPLQADRLLQLGPRPPH